MKIFILVIGVVGVLLGALWLFQGLGILVIPPILCVAECTPLEGPSPVWALTGVVILAAGVFAVSRALRPRNGRDAGRISR